MSLKEDITNKTKEFYNQKFSFDKVNSIPTVHTKQLTFGCTGWSFDAVVLYIDMRHSTKLLDEHRRNVVAKLHMAYYNAIVRIAKADGGEIRSFNGDSLLVFFLGADSATAEKAVRSAFRMKYAITELVNPNLEDYKDINFGIGIDMGNIIATKVGIGGDDTTKDLIWLGNAVNRSTKISDKCEAPYHVGISDAVHNKMPNSLISYLKKENTYFGFQDVKKDVWIQQKMIYNDEWELYFKSSCKIRFQ